MIERSKCPSEFYLLQLELLEKVEVENFEI